MYLGRLAMGMSNRYDCPVELPPVPEIWIASRGAVSLLCDAASSMSSRRVSVQVGSF